MQVAEIAGAWWAWIAPATLLATPLLAFAWLADRALARRVWPQVLAAGWLAALARLVLPPELASPWSVTEPIGAVAGSVSLRASPAAPIEALALVWLAGVAACIACRFVRRRALATRLRDVSMRGGERERQWVHAVERAAARLGARVPRVAALDGLAQPAACGPFRPRLLLPAHWLARSPRSSDRHALMHEVAHLRRGDLWLDETCALLRALFWFHPLVWIAVARLRALGEIACDAEVARALGPEAPEYRDALLRAAAKRFDLAPPAVARGFVARPASILIRIERLARAPRTPPALARAASLGTAAVLAACVLPMAPRASDLRAQARAVFAAERRGELQSCFALQAAAMVLADESCSTSEPER